MMKLSFLTIDLGEFHIRGKEIRKTRIELDTVFNMEECYAFLNEKYSNSQGSSCL